MYKGKCDKHDFWIKNFIQISIPFVEWYKEINLVQPIRIINNIVSLGHDLWRDSKICWHTFLKNCNYATFPG